MRHQKRVQNDAGEAFLALTNYSLANTPRGLTARSRAQATNLIEELVDNGTQAPYESLSLEFDRGGCRVSLYLRFEPYAHERVEQDGDLYYERKFVGEISTSSHRSGASDVMLLASLLTEVALFSTEVLATFSETYHQLIATAAERALQVRKVAQSRFESELGKTCLLLLKGKRAGSSIIHPLQLPEHCTLPAGISVEGKRFGFIQQDGADSVLISRLPDTESANVQPTN